MRGYFIARPVQEQQYQYESYVNPAPPNTSYEWGTLPQKFNADNKMNQWVRIGYTYFPVDGTVPRKNFEASPAPYWHPDILPGDMIDLT